MRVYKCDRCGQFYDEQNVVLQSTFTDATIYPTRYDLCPPCWEAFWKWMAEPKAVAELLFAEQGKEHEAK